MGNSPSTASPKGGRRPHQEEPASRKAAPNGLEGPSQSGWATLPSPETAAAAVGSMTTSKGERGWGRRAAPTAGCRRRPPAAAHAAVTHCACCRHARMHACPPATPAMLARHDSAPTHRPAQLSPSLPGPPSPFADSVRWAATASDILLGLHASVAAGGPRCCVSQPFATPARSVPPACRNLLQPQTW